MLAACGSDPDADPTDTTGAGASASTSGNGADGGSDATGTGGSTLECPTTTLDCDLDPANGCEVDPTTSTAHCGACNHDCLGGTCELGSCSPFIAASGTFASFGPSSVVLDPDWLYLAMGLGTFPGDPAVRIARMPRAGGALQPIASLDDQWPTVGMGLDAQSVFFITHAGLHRAPRAGGAAQALHLDPSLWTIGRSQIAVDDAWVHVTSDVGGFLRVPKSGGAAENIGGIHPGSTFPRGITVIGASVYWSNCSRDVHMRTGDAAPTLLGAGPERGVGCVAGDLPTDGHFLYMSDPEGGTMYRVALDGSGVQPFVSPAYPHVVAANTREVFYPDVPTGILAKAVDGGPEVRVAETSGAISSLVADEQAVYWIETSFAAEPNTWKLRGLVR